MAWTTLTNSTTADADQVMGNFAFLYQNMAPFDSAGTITNNAFNLGTSTALWKAVYCSSISAQSINASGTIAALSQVVAGTYTPSNTALIVAENSAAISIGLAYSFGQISTDGRGVIAQHGQSTGGDLRSQILVACRDAAASMTGVMLIDGNSGGRVMIGGNIAHSQPTGKLDVHVSSATSIVIGGAGVSSSLGRVDISNDGRGGSGYSQILVNVKNTAGTKVDMMLIDGQNSRLAINHTNPSQTLDVSGRIYASGEIRCASLTVIGNTTLSGNTVLSGTLILQGNYGISVRNTTTVNGNALYDVSNDAQQWSWGVFGGVSDAFIIRDGQVGTNTLAIHPLGKVAIGNHTPSQTLDIAGTLAVTGNAVISGTVQAASGINAGNWGALATQTGGVMKYMIVSLPTWNMDSTANITFSFTMAAPSPRNIRGVWITIWRDNGGESYNFETAGDIDSIATGTISLTRVATGLFDSAVFDVMDSTTSRGYATIWYDPNMPEFVT